ncbi:MAG: PQQ-binding-like beta-propeller repeat protein [candidate division Zixibacteria bacterium]|nr:PQQ-binding-like beta-propeller repeat protein [candidate division Zixibacteria bacterium]
MKSRIFARISLAVLACLILACAPGFKSNPKLLGGGNWHWKSFRNAANNQASVRIQHPVPTRLNWRFHAKASNVSTPLVRGNTVILASLDRRIYFLNAGTGSKITQIVLNVPATTPCAAGNVLYFGLSGEDGEVCAFDYVVGQMLWKVKVGEITSPIVLENGKVYVGTASGNLLCLNSSTGKEIWRFKTSGHIQSSVSVERGNLYFGSLDGNLYCLDPADGSQKWKFKSRAGVFTSPAADGENIYFGSADSVFYCLDSSGIKQWEFKTDGAIYSSACLDSNQVYFGSSDGKLYCLAKSTGGLVWEFATGSLIHSSPILVGNAVSFGCFDRNFYTLDCRTGEIAFKYTTAGIISASASFGSGRYFISGEDRYLYCFGS